MLVASRASRMCNLQTAVKRSKDQKMMELMAEKSNIQDQVIPTLHRIVCCQRIKQINMDGLSKG